jgi:hypothetical protein
VAVGAVSWVRDLTLEVTSPTALEPVDVTVPVVGSIQTGVIATGTPATAAVCPGMMIDTGTGRLLVRLMVRVVSAAGTARVGPGTVTTPGFSQTAGGTAESQENPHIETAVPSGIVLRTVPVLKL